ncbi:MAG TPA: xanthine dehydrogenase family protein molybdopterin-binding subunit [Vicinamibacteria bacterium]|jgi:xanthine dehydrogenase YagR molybdenum-binding subunit
MAAQEPPAPAVKTVALTMKAGHASAPEPRTVSVEEGDLAPWDLDSKLVVVGGRRPRLDGPLKVTGRAKYTFDIALPGMLWAKMVRASVPAGEITAIDTSRAEAHPEVKAVWTTESRTVRFAGQDLAAVAATSPEAAEEAARLVKVAYAEKAFVTDLVRAMEPGAPAVYAREQVPGPRDLPVQGNVVGPVKTRSGGRRGDLEKGFEDAEVTVQATYLVPVHTHAALETHGVVARWDGDQLEVWASSQGTFTVQEGMAEALRIDRKNVTVHVEHMGGGFGSKLSPSATGSAFAVVACRLARQAGAPVKLMLDRREEHLCTGNAPSALMTVRLGARRDGTLTALHHRSFGSAGIAPGAGTGGPAAALYQATPALLVEEHHVFTNAGPSAPLRAPGHPQGAFAVESAMDELADRLGLDPLELRRRNESHPVRRVQYDLGAQAIGWERRNKVAGGGDGPRKRGLGMANGNWYVIVDDDTGAEVRIHRDGSVEVFSGAQDIGTGFRTAMAMVAAEELGLGLEDVTPRIGDSRWPIGPASGGSTCTNSVAPAVRLAAHDALRQLLAVAVPLLDARGPEDLRAEGGRIVVASKPSRGLPWKSVAARMPGEVLSAVVRRKKQFETYREDIAGTQFAEVEVDVETGQVRVLKVVSVNDCGLPVNALTTESQIIGGMIQGVSWALWENRILDRNVGTMVNPNLEWYKILGARDMFEAVPILTPVANGGNNTSTAGIGEPPIVPTLAAVANAVFNATGARVRELPITPDRVLAALAERRRS